MNAAELPEGSVVATEHTAWIRTDIPVGGSQWKSTNGSLVGDWKIDQALTVRGAKVLRVGRDG